MAYASSMVELFGSSKANISEHITNIYQQGELVQSATVRKFRTVRKEGNRMVTRNMDYYNLDMIISVGFRVNSHQGIRFRQWANNVLKEYLLRGYAVHQQMLQMEQRIDSKLMLQHDEMQRIRILRLSCNSSLISLFGLRHLLQRWSSSKVISILQELLWRTLFV